jgi:hypothetical protein
MTPQEVKDLMSYTQRLIYALGITFAVDPTGVDPEYGYKHPELAVSKVLGDLRTELDAVKLEVDGLKAGVPGVEPTKIQGTFTGSLLP